MPHGAHKFELEGCIVLFWLIGDDKNFIKMSD